jgi:hypothetical protein
MTSTKKRREIYAMAVGFAVMLAGILAINVFGLDAAMHACLWKGPDFTGRFAVDLAGSDKRAAMGNEPCSLNGWMLSHFLAYAAMAFAFPQWSLAIFGVGVVWEVLEMFVGVSQPMDIIWNGLGVITGALVASTLKRRY